MDTTPTAIARDVLPLAHDTVQRLIPAACDPAIYRLLRTFDGDEGIFGYLQITTEIHGNGLSRLVVSLCPPPFRRRHGGCRPVQLMVSSGELAPLTEAHSWLIQPLLFAERRAGNKLPSGDLPSAQTLVATIAPYIAAAKLAAARVLENIATQQPEVANTAHALMAANRAVLLLHADLHSDNSREYSRLHLALAPVPETRGDPVRLAMIGQDVSDIKRTAPTQHHKKRAAWFFDALALLSATAGSA